MLKIFAHLPSTSLGFFNVHGGLLRNIHPALQIYSNLQHGYILCYLLFQQENVFYVT